MTRLAIRPRLSPAVELAAARLLKKQRFTLAPRLTSAVGPSQVPLLVVLDSPASVSQLAASGIHYRAAVGRVVSLAAGAGEIAQLSQMPHVVSVHLAKRFRALLNVNGQENGAIAARATGASGSGVLVGVIDSGIDFHHQDFRDSAGHTRIKFIWDQLDTSFSDSGGTIGTAPPVDDTGAPVGTVYTEDQINAALDGTGTVNSVDLPGHGTLAASAAAGNGQATGNGQPAGVYVGTAPEASFLIVRIGGQSKTDLNFDGDVVSSLDWIAARADDLGMPVSVNMSFGTQVGPHDGTDPEEMAIDSFVQTPGRAVSVAAGNEGNIAIHATGSDLGSHTLNVFNNDESDSIAVDCWLPGTDIIDLGFTDPQGSGIPDLEVTEGNCATDSNGTNEIEACVGSIDPDNNSREVFFLVQQASSLAPISSGAWQFTLLDKGGVQNGHFDCWSALDQQFTKDADNMMEVSSPGTSNGAVTVGALTARNSWPSLSGTSMISQMVGTLAPFSSPGPTRDGRQKPDITTGGYALVGAWSTADGTGSGLAGVPPDPRLVASDGVHLASSGTSFSTPQVTGAIALLLERYPTLTVDAIKSALTQTARSDSFTGDVPNNSWGSGKLDVAAALETVQCTGVCGSDKAVGLSDLRVSLNIFIGADTTSSCQGIAVGGLAGLRHAVNNFVNDMCN